MDRLLVGVQVVHARRARGHVTVELRALVGWQLVVEIAHEEVDELLTRQMGAGSHGQSFGFVANTVSSVTKPRSSISSDDLTACAISSTRSLVGLSGAVRGARPACAANSVITSLGLMRITRTFDGRSSARQHSVMPLSANLLA